MKGGHPITTAYIGHILENPIYTGHIVHRGEWIEAEVDPLVSREQWDLVQKERIRRAPKRDPNTDFLSGLLYDQHGRHMNIHRLGPGRTNQLRYYHSEAAGWSRKTEHKRVLVEASQVETVVRTALIAMFRDRCGLKDAVLSDCLYSDDIPKLLRKGSVAARRVERMANPELRLLLLALTPRIEVNPTEIRILVSCKELKRFLAWDGIGRFLRNTLGPTTDQAVYVLASTAFLFRGHHRHDIPIRPRTTQSTEPKAELVRLIKEADELRRAVLDRREATLLELAQERRMSRNQAVRRLRLNYLAPDIVTAIIDGSQPAGTTATKLFDAAMTVDWRQQREMLGFGSLAA